MVGNGSTERFSLRREKDIVRLNEAKQYMRLACRPNLRRLDSCARLQMGRMFVTIIFSGGDTFIKCPPVQPAELSLRPLLAAGLTPRRGRRY